MKVTKHGFFLAMMVYMGFQVFIHMTLNTESTGQWSQIYLGWAGADIILFLLTLNHFQLTLRGRIVDKRTAQQMDADDAIDLDISQFGFTDYAYYLVLIAYMLFNCVQHVQGNTNSTGITSVWYALWAFGDVGLAFICCQQLYLIITGSEVKMVASAKAQQGAARY